MLTILTHYSRARFNNTKDNVKKLCWRNTNASTWKMTSTIHHCPVSSIHDTNNNNIHSNNNNSNNNNNNNNLEWIS